MNKIFKEPLLHFLLLGLAIFIIFNLLDPASQNSSDVIIIDDDDVSRIINNYKKSWSENPDDNTLNKLIEEYVSSEILYQEALNLNLDHNDKIIKRRLKQKFEFLIEDLTEQTEIDLKELEAYFQNHKEQYKSSRKISFEQLYFSPDNHQNPEKTASNQLIQFNSSGKVPISDNSHLKSYYEQFDNAAIEREFGSEFAIQLSNLDSKSWEGPLKSGYGYHLVKVLNTAPAENLEFDQVIEKVKSDYRRDLSKDYNIELRNSLNDKYIVKYQLKKYIQFAK